MLNLINIQAIEQLMKSTTGFEEKISDITGLSGGSINFTCRFSFAERNYFLKMNDSTLFPGMFKEEVKGLNELRKINSWIVPELVLETLVDSRQLLIFKFLKKTTESSLFFEKLGVSLASLHRISDKQFGYSSDNYIGSLQQRNKQEKTWADFFYFHRIEPFVKWCYDEKLIQKTHLLSFENLHLRLNELFPAEPPALLHGDLWGGNKMNTDDGPCVFDPAVYYGHREMDIAMTRLFGGFNDEFYTSYNNVFPLEKEYRKRTEICNLYPLLVHVQLFGTSYLHDVIATIKRY